MSQAYDINLALIVLGVAVAIWCAGLSGYALWTTERYFRQSSKKLTESFQAELISAGRKMRASQKH